MFIDDKTATGIAPTLKRAEVLGFLCQYGLLPRFEIGGESRYLRADVEDFASCDLSTTGIMMDDNLFAPLFPVPNQIAIGSACTITFDPHSLSHAKDRYAFLSGVRNLMRLQGAEVGPVSNVPLQLPYFCGSLIRSSFPRVIEYAQVQLSRTSVLRRANAGQFANSAHYMGSKQSLLNFLVEAFSAQLCPQDVVLDLMCGSGVVAGACSRLWRTYASDALSFCLLLANIQGGGFSMAQASGILARCEIHMREHMSVFAPLLEEPLRVEDEMFFRDVDETLLKEYRAFLERFPTILTGKTWGQWYPDNELAVRRLEPQTAPYCLFTAYFSNVYFGVRQCVEIDSIRFAIDHCADKSDRDLALGALIAAVSEVASNYGGHFAQPKYGVPSTITLKNLPIVLEKRSLSVFQEFAIRLLRLAAESERSANAVQLLKGPWQNTLEQFATHTAHLDAAKLVYIDAPYKRDEYSRYYHVLETLVQYNYPGCIGKGRLPEKKQGERFASEFFSRRTSDVNDHFTTMIGEIIQRGWKCAWSYAAEGQADIASVVNKIHLLYGPQILSYSVPYEHRSLGSGRNARKVTERLVLFIPN